MYMELAVNFFFEECFLEQIRTCPLEILVRGPLNYHPIIGQLIITPILAIYWDDGWQRRMPFSRIGVNTTLVPFIFGSSRQIWSTSRYFSEPTASPLSPYVFRPTFNTTSRWPRHSRKASSMVNGHRSPYCALVIFTPLSELQANRIAEQKPVINIFFMKPTANEVYWKRQNHA